MSKNAWLLVAGLSLLSPIAVADIAPPEEAKTVEPAKKKKKVAPPGNPRAPVTAVGTKVGTHAEPTPGRRPAPGQEPVGKRAPTESPTVGTHMEADPPHEVGREADPQPTRIGQTRGREPAPPTDKGKVRNPPKPDTNKTKTTYGDAPNP